MITSLEPAAFRGNKLLEVVILPATISSVGSYSLGENPSLISCVVLAETPPAFDNAFANGTSCDVYVPDSSVEAYKTASGWNSYASRIKPLSEFTE